VGIYIITFISTNQKTIDQVQIISKLHLRLITIWSLKALSEGGLRQSLVKTSGSLFIYSPVIRHQYMMVLHVDEEQFTHKVPHGVKRDTFTA